MSELEIFVLGYVEALGGIVEPIAFDVHELLLPETVAARWNVPAYQQITFAEQAPPDATRLGYNHPQVEQMVQEAHAQPASTRLYINGLRLDKSNLESLAAANWVIPNGRVTLPKRATVARVRSTYVRFNFKAAILSDEKQERLVSVMMDAHAGHRVADAAQIEARANAVTPEGLLETLPDAPMRWQPDDGGPPLRDPLELRALEGLLARAKTAVLQEMAADMSALQKRVLRFRQLDEARLIDYYDELARDLQQRLKSASAERRPGLEDKLTAVQTERVHKLADLAERYQVQVNLTLLNLLVIQQAKLSLPVTIENRTTTTPTHAIWDPLRYQVEPLVCQVCGQPGQRLYLCFNGHLAHEDCLAPACIDCKRVFCGVCVHEVGECAVCHAPLCRHSRLTCPECGRGTCKAHAGLCHANAGQPVDLSRPARAAEPPPPAPPPPPSKPAAKPKAPSAARAKPKAPPRRPTAPSWPKGVPKPQRIEVILYPNAVTAFVIGARERQIAMRIWELIPEDGGIVCTCECEKGAACRANRMVSRPSDRQPVTRQMYQELLSLAEEYGLSNSKIRYNRVSSLDGSFFPTPNFELTGVWRDETALEEARRRFAEIYW